MLTDDNKKRVLDHLNEICPDTFDEGAFGPWTFTDLGRAGSTWTLSFTNVSGRGTVQFDFKAGCLDAKGRVTSEWFEKVNARILEWESSKGGSSYTPYNPDEEEDEA